MQGLLEKSNILDYSFEAQKITAKVNRAVDRAERYSRITGTPINLEKVRTKVRNHWGQ